MFPINLRLTGRKVLLVGAGKVGRRKLDKLIKAEAWILVVEPNPDEGLRAMAAEVSIKMKTSVGPNWGEGWGLEFAAATEHGLKLAVAKAAGAKGGVVNGGEAPGLSDFILPAVGEDGDFQGGISTGGARPALAAKVAADLRDSFGPTYGRLTQLASILRPIIMSAGLSQSERDTIFKRLINSVDLKNCLADRDMISAVKLVRELVLPIQLNKDFNLD